MKMNHLLDQKFADLPYHVQLEPIELGLSIQRGDFALSCSFH